MPVLFTLDEFADRLTVDLTVTDIQVAVERARHTATQQILSRLRMRMPSAESGVTDDFHIPRSYGGASHLLTPLRLSRVFVDASTVTVRSAPSFIALRNGNENESVDLRDLNGDGQSDYTIIDGERGTVDVVDQDLAGRYVRVTYDAGLEVSQDDVISAPDWLREAAISQAIIALRPNETLVDADDFDFDGVQREIVSAIDRYGRHLPSRYRPFGATP